MKKIVSLIISFCLILGLVFFTYPSFDVNASPSLSDYWEEYYDYIADGYASGNFLNGIGRSLVAGIVTPIRYYTDPNFGTGSKNDPYSVTSSPVSESSAILNYDFSDNSMNTYNFLTNEYNNVVNVYKSSSTTNTEYQYLFVTDEDYNIYVSFNGNGFDYSISDTSSNLPEYFKVYFELPDGRSSFNLTRDDLYGYVFNYDTILYDYVPVDSSILGLYHLDGSNLNEVMPDFDGSLSTNLMNYSDGRFDGASYFYTLCTGIPSVPQGFSSPYLNLPLPESVGNDYTVDFWCKAIYHEFDYSAYGDTYTNYYYGFFNKNDSAWHHYKFYFSPSGLHVWIDGIYKDTNLDYFRNHPSVQTMFEVDVDGVKYFRISPYLVRSSTYTWVFYNYDTLFDEIAIHSGLYGAFIGEDFTLRLEPFDLPYAFVRPSDPVNSTVAIQSLVPVNNVQFGGVRSLNPEIGDVFYFVSDNNRVSSVQQFFGGIWNEVPAAVFFNGFWVDILKFDLSNFMVIPDVLDSAVSLLDKILVKLDQIKASIGSGGSGGSGGNQYEQFDPSDPKNVTFPYDPNIKAPDNSGFSHLDFLLIFLYLVMVLVIIVKVFNLFLGFVSYLFTLISIPASTLLFETSEKFSYLDENGLSRNYIQDVFGVLKGEVHFGLEEPLYAINIGDIQITLFTFMVMLFQMVIIGAILWFMHTKTASIDVPKWRD